MSGRTHYEILGVASDAGAATIREAYRRLAREHHPDRAARGVSSAAPRSATMPEINEAYRVLNDPGRRAVYDATLRTRSGPTSGAPENAAGPPPMDIPQHPSHVGPARIPWRSMLVVGVVAVIGVVVLAQFTEPGEPRGPDGILRIGDCVALEANGDAREVLCTGDVEVDIVVEAFVAFDATCPGGTEPHRDRQGMGVACIDLR